MNTINATLSGWTVAHTEPFLENLEWEYVK
jgi:hypothetical protein